MKKIWPVLLVFVIVVSIIGLAKVYPAWASPKLDAGDDAPLLTQKTITENSLSNIGGVCLVDVKFLTTGNKVQADSEVPIDQSKVVPFYRTDGSNLLFPGCHLVFYKDDKIVSPVNTNDVTTKICFGASAHLKMGMWYYLDSPASGDRVWIPLPSWLEDEGRQICSQAIYTGVYMPTGKVVPPPGTGKPGENVFFPGGWGGTVVTPPNKITIRGSGSYVAGGLCMLRTKYYVTGLSDTVEVEYPRDMQYHYTEETFTVPYPYYEDGNLFYYPGCHVVHYRDELVDNQMVPVIQDEMNKVTPKDGDWEICFAAVPNKIMTIYYYDDNLSDIKAPWKPRETTTANGLACATVVDFSAVYVPAAR
jgi:hypothetical protein